MFPSMLKTAMKQGIYKEYRKVQYNDSNVRGTIDISRHIRENIPFCGNISYDTEEFCYDNAVMELIRHTIEYIITIPLGDMILSSNEVVEEYVTPPELFVVGVYPYGMRGAKTDRKSTRLNSSHL